MRYPPSARTRPCELCSCDRFEVVGDLDRRNQPLVSVVCCRCGLISHEQVPDDNELAEYYADHYRQDYHGEKQPRPHRVIRAWQGGEWLCRLLKPYLTPGDRVCEIGAGIGCTVKQLELQGFDSRGIEPGLGFQEFSEQVLRAPVIRQRWEDMTEHNAYDFVLLVHVIEHLNSPRAALDHIRRLLTPGGHVYVECPNVVGPHAAPGRQFHYAHIYNFAPHTLVWLARDCGLAVRACLAAPNERVLRYIFSRADGPLHIQPESGYERTIRAFQRYGWLGYHLRWSYFQDKLARDRRFLSSRIMAARQLDQIVAYCDATQPYRPRERRAA